MRILTLLLIFCFLLLGDDIKPQKSIKISSPATDLVFRGQKIYASTDKGDIYEISKSGQAKKIHSLPHMVTPEGQKIAQKALTIDVSPTSKTIVIAAEDGYLYCLEKGALKPTGYKTNSTIKKVAMLSDTLVLVGLVSSQITLFDISKNKAVYSVQIGTSPFSDMALSSDKKSAAIAGEAGVVYILDTANGKIKKAFKNVNLDNIYKIDYQNGFILTAGQDRKAVLLADSGVIKARFGGEFLIYAAGLSPLASKAAIAINEQSDIAVFDTATKSQIVTAKGHNAILNRIVFLNENEFVSCADENKILTWRIK